ncbi:hypothetical protein GCM10027421_31910 [Microbacterium shaanxiense]
MRLSNTEHTSRPWRIHAIVPDFVVEDVWALPVHGRATEFTALAELMTDSDNEERQGEQIDFLDSAAARFLWRLRDLLGRLFRLGTITEPSESTNQRLIPGDDRASLAERLDEDLVGTAAGVHFSSVPMTALYQLDDEFAAEISNATMHGVMHLSWVPRGAEEYQGQMAVLVKPRGRFGSAYMTVIKPFRYLIVYPALLRHLEKSWNARSQDAATPNPQRVSGG